MSEKHVSEPTAETDIGWALGVLLRTYRDVVTPALGDFPCGPRGYQTMREVIQGDHPSQLALANHLGIDRTVMTYLIDDLVEIGWVERRTNPADRRQRQVVATELGRKAVADLCEKVAQAECAVLEGLDASEQVTFRRLLGKAASVRGADATEACLAVMGQD